MTRFKLSIQILRIGASFIHPSIFIFTNRIHIHIEEDNEEEIEQPKNVNMVPAVPMCLSCGEPCVEKYFFGCGHSPYCQDCQGNPTCSICNQDVQFRTRMLENLNM